MGRLRGFLLDMLGSCPSAGQGVHRWLFTTARQLHAHLDPEEIIGVLGAAAAGCGRVVTDGEIRAAVNASRGCAWRPGAQHPGRRGLTASKWPPADETKIAAILRGSPVAGLADLWEASPVRFDDDAAHTREVLGALFPNDALVCVGVSSSMFQTNHLSSLGELSRFSLIVPSPMAARFGQTKAGKLSAHTLANCGPRQFIVVESDRRQPDGAPCWDEASAVAWHLRQFLPLVLVVWSGNKSLHAWFRCAGLDEDRQILPFMKYACHLGADPAGAVRSQFARMPDGLRRDMNGAPVCRQSILYFDPGALTEYANDPLQPSTLDRA